MSEDLRVLGLVAGIHVIEDIGIAVPLGVEVTISAQQANMSKDLWRALGQKKLFQFPMSAGPPKHVPHPSVVRDDVLQERLQFLERRTKELEDENQRLRESLTAATAQQVGLDRILNAIENAKFAGPTYSNGQGHGGPPQVLNGLADGTAPQFIPSEIAPKDASSRIDLVKQESDNEGVLDAAAALRRLRRGVDS